MDTLEKTDIFFRFTPVQQLSIPNCPGSWIEDLFFTDGAVFHCDRRYGTPYARVSRRDNLVLCEYASGMEDKFAYSSNVFDVLALETMLLACRGLLLHCSFVRYADEAILFTAPSGTGKSTQADLWVSYAAAEVINGDRAGLRCENNRWSAWGLPYAGSSGIYRNESAPIKAVVVLRQAKENKIRRLNAAEALRMIYPEVSIHHWDSAFVNRALNLMIALVSDVPVYLLECLPDQGAVQLLKDVIFAEGDRL